MLVNIKRVKYVIYDFRQSLQWLFEQVTTGAYICNYDAIMLYFKWDRDIR